MRLKYSNIFISNPLLTLFFFFNCWGHETVEVKSAEESGITRAGGDVLIQPVG